MSRHFFLSLIIFFSATHANPLPEWSNYQPLQLNDLDLECRVRELAYKYGMSKQPWRSPQQDTFDALMLSKMCHFKIENYVNRSSLTDQRRVSNNGWPFPARIREIFHPKSRENLTQVTLYVDGTNGNDQNSGTITSPLKTIEKALQISRHQKSPASIIIRQGIYFLMDTIKFSPSDSGLVMKAYEKEEVWISGGTPLENLEWERYQTNNPNQNIWKTSLAGYPIGSNVTGLFTLETHRRLTRARYPNADIELYNSPGHDISRNLVQEWWMPGKFALPKQNFLNITCGSGVMPCKDDSTMTGYNLYGTGTGGPCSLWSPTESYWCSNISAGGWAFMEERMAREGKRQLPIGMTVNQSALPRLNGWTNPAGGIVHAWHDQTWFTDMFEIGQVDANSRRISFTRGGWQGGRNWHTKNADDNGILISGNWYVENILEELDTENEWFFDPKTKMLYYWPNNTRPGQPPPSDVTLVATRLKHLIEFKGTQSQPVSQISLDGLGFRDAALTYMDVWGVPSGGDWSLYRGAAITLTGTNDVSISNGMFRRLDGNAIILTGYNRGGLIANNEFAWIGDNAMAGWGDTKENDGTNGDQPRQIRIVSNFVHELGLYEKQSSMWFQARTCQIELDSNIFFNGPRAAINFNDGFGGGNVVSNSLIFNTCRESGDHGPINSWDRMPFLTKVAHGYPSYDSALTVTKNNLIMANYGGSQAFDNDDGSSFYDTHDNFFYAADGFKMDYGGHDSKFHHNVIVTLRYDGQNCFNTASFFPRHGDMLYENTCVIFPCGNGCTDHVASLYNSCYKGSALKMFNNSYYTEHGNASVTCGGRTQILLKDFQAKYQMDLGSIGHKLPTNDQIMQWANRILGM